MTLHNKIFVLAYFEQKNFGSFFLSVLAIFGQNFFCSKSAETKILFSNVDMGIKLYLISFFDLCCQKIEPTYAVNSPWKNWQNV